MPREAFLGPGPWLISDPLDRTRRYRPTDDADPRRVYHDVLIALDPARELNNGVPSALARWIAALAPQPGDHVVHIGCGTGYYTAILGELVGPAGSVVAYEVDPTLAARATAALTTWPQIEVRAGDGATEPFAPAILDAILVNAGVTTPRAAWLDALAPGGRLVVPLTVHIPDLPGGVGAMVRIDRMDRADHTDRKDRTDCTDPTNRTAETWPLRVISPVGIYDCAGARDPAHEAELKNLLRPGAADPPLTLSRVPHNRATTCLVHLPGFCIQRNV